jgi:hypothetical protein
MKERKTETTIFDPLVYYNNNIAWKVNDVYKTYPKRVFLYLPTWIYWISIAK